MKWHKSTTKIAIANPHQQFDLAADLKELLKEKNHK
jgi:hypothetical protein